MRLTAPVGDLACVGQHLGRDLEVPLGGEAEHPLGGGHLLLTERRAVGGSGVAGARGGPGDDGAGGDDRRPVGHRPGGGERGVKGMHIDVPARPLPDVLHMPAVGLVPLQYVLGERGGGVSLDGDVVVVVQDDEVAELLVPGQ